VNQHPFRELPRPLLAEVVEAAVNLHETLERESHDSEPGQPCEPCMARTRLYDSLCRIHAAVGVEDPPAVTWCTMPRREATQRQMLVRYAALIIERDRAKSDAQAYLTVETRQKHLAAIARLDEALKQIAELEPRLVSIRPEEFLK
jgi:hypothetical protein